MMIHYLKVDGFFLKSTNPEYPDWMDVQSSGFGSPSHGVMSHGTGDKRKGSELIGDLQLVFQATYKIWSQFQFAAAAGNHLKSATMVSILRPGDGSSKQQLQRLRMTFTGVTVDSTSIHDRKFSELETFSASLIFSSFEITYGFVPPLHETVHAEHQHWINQSKARRTL